MTDIGIEHRDLPGAGILGEHPALLSAMNRVFELTIGFLAVLWSWKISAFWYDEYWDLPRVLQPLRGIAGLGFVVLACVGLLLRIPRATWRMVLGYWFLGLILVPLSVLSGGLSASDFLFFAAAAVGSLGILWITRDVPRFWNFIRLNFAIGMTFILLNSVTVLHWYGVIHLPNRIVPRGITDAPEYLDPVYFGTFGLTESTAVGSFTRVPRLQGWSLEPIHWAYFVLCTAACGFLLLARRPSQAARFVILTALAMLTLHMVFIGSAAMVLTVALIAAAWSVYWFLTRLGVPSRRRTVLTLITAVVIPGIIIPFALVQLPNVEALLVGESLFEKGSNWADKISFLTMGSGLYYRFIPGVPGVSASHNFVLWSYLIGGYVLLVPLLCFLFAILKQGLAGRSMWLTGGVLTLVLAQLYTLPGSFFRPSGALYLFLALRAGQFAVRPVDAEAS